ncbi:site-specific integrase [Proteus mirabilis]|uniref:site-specific integrase n=1 Tax=Proteus mirabilis TaxID=584 RepID=UPI001A18ED6A|nr:site-specific integrase [Proteus mirabilis]EKU6440738.1 site-specific integrase [Proteus mirabilis]EKU6778491.1 site-specific integrase [Proteus mirabilis]EKU7262563.1 site-specific integrase [Proteus mirabilis]EKV5076188.1 site-specific integrase [Proteus mirabilis]EKX6520779.1 site-specific integrase [Proteus mirabilis]
MLNSFPLSTYLYQRNGVYYIRMRVKLYNQYKLTSLSLKTKDRRIAMANSRHIKSALKEIYADRPNVSYEELREHLKTIVEWELSVRREDMVDPMAYQLYVDQYDETIATLREAIATESLTATQHKYINDVIGVLKASQSRLRGDSSGLLGYLKALDSKVGDSLSLSVSPPQVSTHPQVSTPNEAITLSSLIALYEAEHSQSWKPSTLRDNKASHEVLAEIFDYLCIGDDINKATRADMLKVRDILQVLPKNRKQRFKGTPLADLLSRDNKDDCLDVVTINNNYLVKLSALFKWALKNGLVDKNMTEGLELKVPQHKASNDRKAFSPEQVKLLVSSAKDYSQKTTGRPYHYYVPLLASITGARLNEVAQLQVKDIKKTEEGTVYIHINEDDRSLEGKSIKNVHSDRCVPLVDGAYGFVLGDFLKLVDKRRETLGDEAMVFDGLKLMKNGYGEQVSKWFNRTLLPKVIPNREGLAFHSFRHTVATQLKQHGVQLAYAQALLGHSSGSITYDRYAKEVEVERLRVVLEEVFVSHQLGGTSVDH